MKKNNVGIAFFFVVTAFVLTMSILMSIFFGINRYVMEQKSHIPMYVFCLPSADKSSVDNLVASIEQQRGVIKAHIIYKEAAFKEMVSKFSIDKSLFDKNPFPYSIELFFESKYTNVKYFQSFENKIKSNKVVESVRYPKNILININSVLKRVTILGDAIFSILYAVEFIVFISIITVLYSHKRNDFNTLKFLGITRPKIFFLFLKKTLLPAVFASLFSVLFIILIYFFYDKYANIYYIDKALFTSSLLTTFVLNVAIGILFTLFSSFFVFAVNDEKV